MAATVRRRDSTFEYSEGNGGYVALVDAPRNCAPKSHAPRAVECMGPVRYPVLCTEWSVRDRCCALPEADCCLRNVPLVNYAKLLYVKPLQDLQVCGCEAILRNLQIVTAPPVPEVAIEDHT